MSQISQVEGCTFSTEELQKFHKFYTWSSADLDLSTVDQRIDYFSSNIDPSIDTQRLREWLSTMDLPVVDELYSRFDAYDFAHAPGFNNLLAEVYNTKDVNKHELDLRMEQAKARYYNEHVEPFNCEEYRAYKEASAPKPVCPYQHLWDHGDERSTGRRLDNVCVVDLADYLDQPVDSKELLTLATVSKIHDAIRQAYEEQYYAIAIINSNTDDSRPFLPPLERQQEAFAALLRLQIELRQLNQSKPVVVFASGPVDASTIGVVLSTADVITTDNFSVSLSPVQEFPLAALYDWSTRLEYPGTAVFIACHPDLILRSSEWTDLGLGQGFIAHRNLASSMDRVLLAASCPPPSTRDALRKAYMAESVYPGPSKISVWRPEIERYFAPVSQGIKSLDELIGELSEFDTAWARKYLALIDDKEWLAVARLRVAALRSARDMEYSRVLAMEFAVTNAWTKDSSLPADVLIKSPADDSLSDILNVPKPAVDIPDECPFAKMYRKNPERFRQIDLQQITKHRHVDLQ
ncbi:hypothetical protein IW146_003264 [Coemansia sp. RSA 922]|nr:hypothetical protein GGH13_000942 [Coemansia sp. S155-1]KAJ2114208.1 hypothetical protein IW146_003264 [Coemansia sp. RSA 922]